MSYNAIRDMFKTVLETEEMVLDLYQKITMKINNEEITDVLRGIMKDEAKHIENAKEMLRILGE